MIENKQGLNWIDRFLVKRAISHLEISQAQFYNAGNFQRRDFYNIASEISRDRRSEFMILVEADFPVDIEAMAAPYKNWDWKVTRIR